MTNFDPTINPHALDQEWLRQAPMYHGVAVQVADARRDVEEAKRVLDVAAAELMLAIRKDPAAYGLEKPTVDQTAAAVQIQPAHKRAATAQIEAKHALDMLTAAQGAMDHKKRALENLVHLQSQSYYSEPRAETPADREVMAEVGKQAARGKGTKQHAPPPIDDEVF